jgi:hypothetical protein
MRFFSSSLLFVMLLLPFCGCGSDHHPGDSGETLMGVYPQTSSTSTITVTNPALRANIETVVPIADVIRGSWTYYSYPPDKGYNVPPEKYKGYRVSVRITSITWVEVYPPVRTRFWMVSRGLVGGQPGAILLRLDDVGRTPSKVAMEAFVPDARGTAGLFRTREKDGWTAWRNGEVVNELR